MRLSLSQWVSGINPLKLSLSLWVLAVPPVRLCCSGHSRWKLAIGEEIIGSSSKESAGSQQHENLKGEEEERGGGQTDLLTDQREPSIEEG